MWRSRLNKATSTVAGIGGEHLAAGHTLPAHLCTHLSHALHAHLTSVPRIGHLHATIDAHEHNHN